MNIYFKGYELTFELNKVVKQTGVCSKIGNSDKHIFMADFDNIALENVKKQLLNIQNYYVLSDVVILESSKNNYHAYSYVARDFNEICKMLLDLPDVDETFFRLGVARGYWTLRISDRKNSKITKVYTLLSRKSYEMSPLDLMITEYITMNLGDKPKEHS